MNIMIKVKETQLNGHIAYIKEECTNDGIVVSTEQINISVKQAIIDGFTYLILYDNEMNIIENAFMYLNFKSYGSTKNTASLNSRFQKARVLKTFYAFLAIFNYDINSLAQNEIQHYIDFLKGLPATGSEITARSIKTINIYLSIVRDYFKRFNIDCNALFEKKEITQYYAADRQALGRGNRIAYDINPRYRSFSADDIAPPRYISPDEFKKLYGLAKKKNDHTAMLLMELMYCYGLRLGECLGLTMEDFAPATYQNRSYYVMKLRNRVSDNKDQYCKNLIHPVDRSIYTTSEYIDSTQKIVITERLYHVVENYIENTFEPILAKHPDKHDVVEADIVDRNQQILDNCYLFLNKTGNRLTAATWNRHLRNYFVEAGIDTDKGTRQNNLSHRFRHGFAMFHAHFREDHLEVLELSKMMRHRSLQSTLIYYNPTFEDQIALTEEFQDNLYKDLMEFSVIPNDEQDDEEED